MSIYKSRSEFWDDVIDPIKSTIVRCNMQRMKVDSIKPQDDGIWLLIDTDIADCFFSVALRSVQGGFQQRTQIDLVIDRPNCEDWNHAVFQELQMNRWLIEAPFNRLLHWQSTHIANGSQINRRLIGVDNPFHIGHLQHERDRMALITWVVTNLSSFYYVIDQTIDGAIDKANVVVK